MRTQSPTPGAEICDYDGVPIADHRHCRQCTIIVGAFHYAKELSPDGLCPLCVNELARKAERAALMLAKRQPLSVKQVSDMMGDTELVTLDEAAARLGVCRDTVKSYINRGIISGVVINHAKDPKGWRWRVVVESLRALTEDQTA